MKFFHKTFSIFFVLALVFGGAFSASAWQDPVGGFPAGNVPAPINTGSSDQVKAGGGIGASFFAGKQGLFVNEPQCSGITCQIMTPGTSGTFDIFQALAVSDLGNIAGTILKGISIGTDGTFNIRDGNPLVAGKVLTSDANGNATWQPSSGGTGSATLPSGQLNETLRHNGTDWEATNGLLSTGASAAVVGTGGSLKLISPNQSHAFMEWFIGGSGSNSTWATNLSGTNITRGAWAGFGDVSPRIFTISNEYGAGTTDGSLNAPGSILLDPGQNGAIGINSPDGPDSRHGTTLDVAGKVRIRGGDPDEGEVLTVVNPAGNGGVDGYAEWRPIMPDIKIVHKSDYFTSSEGDAARLTASCPSEYIAIAVSCDSNHDAGVDECKLIPEPGFIDNDGGRNYTPGQIAGQGLFTGGSMSSVANQESDNTITLTCLRVFDSSDGSGGGTGGSTSTLAVNLQSGGGSYCPDVTLTAAVTGGTAPYTYTWFSRTGTSFVQRTETTASISPNLAAPGTYYFKVTIRDAAGNTVGSTTRTVTMYTPNPSMCQ